MFPGTKLPRPRALAPLVLPGSAWQQGRVRRRWLCARRVRNPLLTFAPYLLPFRGKNLRLIGNRETVHSPVRPTALRLKGEKSGRLMLPGANCLGCSTSPPTKMAMRAQKIFGGMWWGEGANTICSRWMVSWGYLLCLLVRLGGVSARIYLL